MDSPDLKAPQHYINRELSFLEFNQRVLDQAFDETVPLLERLKFLCISCSNLDEFFEIRVAGLKQLQELGGGQLAADGLSIPEQLTAIHDRATRLVADQYRCLNEPAAAGARRGRRAAAGARPSGRAGRPPGSSSTSSARSSRC